MDRFNCPMCGDLGCLLGRLGALLWLKCRSCGMEWNTPERTANDAGAELDEAIAEFFGDKEEE